MKQPVINDSEDRITQIALRETNVKPFPPGTVLIVIRSGILSRTLPVAVAGVWATINQDLKGVFPFHAIDSLFITHFLRGNESKVLRMCSKNGTTVASIDTKALHSFEVRLPPLNEQRRIVAKIEELFSNLDAGVAALERAKANLKRYRASVLKAAVEGRLTADWRAAHPDVEPAEKLLERILAERREKWEADQLAKFQKAGKQPPKGWREKYKQPKPPETSGLPELPERWCWATLELIKSFAMYGPRFSSADYAPEGILVLRTTDFADDGRINFVTPPRLPLDELTYNRYALMQGDLLITRTGSLGTLAIFPGGAKAIAGAFLIYYRLCLVRESVQFIYHFLKSPSGNSHLIRRGAGVGRPNLNIPAIDSIPIPFPSLPEQREINLRIAEMNSQIEAAETAIEQGLKRAARLRQSILKRAFEGKLVPQDPEDEPAVELLERIKAERVKADGEEIKLKSRRRRAKA